MLGSERNERMTRETAAVDAVSLLFLSGNSTGHNFSLQPATAHGFPLQPATAHGFSLQPGFHRKQHCFLLSLGKI
ncbi:hypothetical protein CUMW_019470, partial [Citrus unshiu]